MRQDEIPLSLLFYFSRDKPRHHGLLSRDLLNQSIRVRDSLSPFPRFAHQQGSQMTWTDRLRPAAIIQSPFLIQTIIRFLQRSINNSGRDASTTTADDWLLSIYSFTLK